MRHLFLLICFIALFLFVSCIPDEEYECFPAARIYFNSTSKIDSVHFFLNNEQICFQEAIINNDRCENCEKLKGVPSKSIYCQTSVDSVFFSGLQYNKDAINNCLVSDDFPILTIFKCFIDEGRLKKTLDSSKLSLHVFSENVKKSIESKITIQSGLHYDIIAKEDTAKWYSYTQETLRYYFNYYGPSEGWERKDCFDGYCVVAHPRVEKVACRDK